MKLGTKELFPLGCFILMTEAYERQAKVDSVYELESKC